MAVPPLKDSSGRISSSLVVKPRLLQRMSKETLAEDLAEHV
jgi:hypothetical protein